MKKLFKRLNSKEWLMVLASIAFVCLTVWLELEVPNYMSEITKLLQFPDTTTSELWSPGLKMLGLSLASFGASVMVGFMASRLAASFTTRLRKDIFHRVLDYSDAEIKHFSIPSLLTRTTNDLTQIQLLFTMGLQVVTRGPIMAIWALSKIVGKSDNWLWAVTGAVLINLVMMTILVTLAFPKQTIVQKLTDRLNSITREGLIGIRIVRAYNAEDYQNRKFAQANEELTSLNLFVSRLMALMNPVMMTISSSLGLAIYWIGAYLINRAEVPDKLPIFSDMVVFMSYAMQVVMGFMMMSALFIILPRVLVSTKRINEVLDLTSSIISPQQSQSGAVESAQIIFDDVTFRYSDTSEPVIEHINFTAKAGDTVAFIGSTGSGKSTLVNLIPRFYDVSEGQILLDGVDVRDYSQADLHAKVGYIPQKAVLFSGDIRSNIDFGESKESPLNDEAIWEALDLAQAKSFVEEKEDGLSSPVAQSGSNFSGGQRQRLAIARALARKPEILIFDDSFSALDYRTDRMLREELAAHTVGMTKLIVAQRISTIMDADQILVLDKGKVVGQGTHKELLASNEVYQEIAYSQLSKEELENEQ
ncbi:MULTISPECIES: ABC transporter ATP-binding protein [unclassified Streptococcus]|uniref:ABC transporter ATP-binding protein n=1 Tax=unclassified Streptococcus TaxID=2608887 RepID=UPI0010717993|nr:MULTISPECIES: ABC transporter ATP-binding protein [unclassified Streptococcus]MBF0787371.1 ABC transporter ATP-binding protein [Streptococcus sp. 19428wC2_LYSM12]MCQ9211090.1 ABC transporter ATP-binding protein/permease [Streptococcus sp. B01]MCQ9214365.1 ABC transporter ATP-binding protein/permease [Streptococcus sp. O1]TFV05715.1 ABC transporter ATP-binding protein [Streptococcus sp. LYSM12]